MPALSPLEAAFDSWISGIENESIPDHIAAVNLGLFETPDGYAAYLIGSQVYNPEDDDWACEEDYVPESKYLESPDALSGRTWQDVHAIYAQLMASYLSRRPNSRLLQLEAATVGFDDGNLELVHRRDG